jgi:HEAT repeat protein
VVQYRSAVKAGEERAGEQLIEMLENPECRVRVEAAEALGDLRVVSARRGLETLAKKGGAGEKTGLFGCDSRGAAERALERLGR